MGFAELCFFLWVYVIATVPEYRLSKKQLQWFLIPGALLVTLTISALMAPNQNMAFWSSFERGTGLIFLYHCFAFSFVIASLVRVHGQEFFSKVLQVVFYSGIIVALSTFISAHVINIPSLFLLGKTDSADLFGNSSHSAAYLLFSLFLGCVLVFHQYRKKRSLFWILLGMGIIFLSPLLDHARAVLGGIVVGAFVSVCIWLIIKQGKRMHRIAGSVMLGLILIGTASVSILVLKPTTRLHQAFIAATTDSRFIFWDTAIQGIKERPVLGWGPENYGVVFTKYFNPKILEPGSTYEVWVDKIHNIVLESFVSGGFIGGILYLGFFGLLIFTPFYLYKRKKLEASDTAVFVGLAFAYLLQGMVFFDTVVAYIVLFSLFGLLSGSVPTALGGQTLSTTQTRVTDTSTKITIVILCVAGFVGCWFYFVHQPVRKAHAIVTMFSVTSPTGANFNMLTEMTPMGEGSEIGFIATTLMKAYRANTDLILKNPDLIKATHAEIMSFLEQADKASGVAANHGRLWLTSAEMMVFDIMITEHTDDQSAIDRTLSYLEKIKALSPGNPRVYWIYGQLYVTIGDYAKAKTAFQTAYDIDPKIPTSQQYLTVFEKTFGKKVK
jgi:O-antigen ligase